LRGGFCAAGGPLIADGLRCFATRTDWDLEPTRLTACLTAGLPVIDLTLWAVSLVMLPGWLLQVPPDAPGWLRIQIAPGRSTFRPQSPLGHPSIVRTDQVSADCLHCG
jgi:hypothetical protein